MKDIDREDRARELQGRHAMVVALAASNEFKWFLALVDRKIDRERLALEKDSDSATTATIRGRIAALRSVAGILTDEQTTIANEMRNQGVQT